MLPTFIYFKKFSRIGAIELFKRLSSSLGKKIGKKTNHNYFQSKRGRKIFSYKKISKVINQILKIK